MSGQVRMLYFSDLKSMQNPFPKLCQFLLLKNQCNPKPRGNFSEINSLFSPKTLSIKNGEGINLSIGRKLGNLKKTHIGDHRRVHLSEGPYIGMTSSQKKITQIDSNTKIDSNPLKKKMRNLTVKST